MHKLESGLNMDRSNQYSKEGFCLSKLHSAKEYSKILAFCESWIFGVLEQWIAKENLDLCNYDSWFEKFSIPHDTVFVREARYCNPPEEIRGCLLNENVKNKIFELTGKNFDVWDEGVGFLGYRIIRGGYGDGYPLTRKNWGTAPGVISFWMPLWTSHKDLNIGLVPKSHLLEVKKYMPANSKFMREYRVCDTENLSNIYRPDVPLGQVLIFHPNLIHTENSGAASGTRINLEFRVITKS